MKEAIHLVQRIMIDGWGTAVASRRGSHKHKGGRVPSTLLTVFLVHGTVVNIGRRGTLG